MSARYSNSPALHLRIADSPLRRLCQHLLALLCLGSLWLLARGGYPALACSLIAPTAYLLYQCWPQPLLGAGLGWRGGQWWLQRVGDEVMVQLLPGSVCLPWVVYLKWRELPSGRRGQLWLFADSVPGHELRQLRVRLTIDRSR